ncbi:DedA family protein [Bradyrhizobium canariense]|uniref:DedA family protein n=1 Tax=Bradyrhizobium canariense TaxID=255045 RepID=UPI001FEBC837|nr:DedA family protein [Bradyrhizobium canariense]MBW5435313.1 DedA family protein [Bradyrhizobium canariense]
MLDQVLAAVANWIIGSISDLGYFGLVILMAVESACVPLPSEIIMPFAGYLVFAGRFSLLGAATMGAIGCNLGSTLAYLIAAKGGRKAIERWGAYVLLRPAELAKAEQFFARYGSMAVFVSRLLPVIRTFIAFPAGLARMPMVKFQVYTFLGSWPWCFSLAYIGYLVGERWHSDTTFRRLFHQFDAVILLALVIACGWFVWSRGRRRFRPRK